MADTCYNSLKITGSVEDMKEFYALLNSNDDCSFYMDKFIPIPVELYGTDSPNRFEPVSKKTLLTEEGKKKHHSVDKDGRTKTEFKLYLTELEQKYGHNNAVDWCLENWGNCYDVDNQFEPENNSEIQYTVFYQTPWGTTFQFVDNLYHRFPHLSFVLSYHSTLLYDAGTYFRSSTRDIFIEKPCIQIQFLYDKNMKKCVFIVDEENEDCQENENKELLSIDIIGYDWETILGLRGVTSSTVVNWKDLKDFFNF